MNGLLKCLLVPVAILVTFDAWSSPLMREGLWEIQTQMEMPGMPKGMPGMGGMTQKHCYTKEDVREDKGIVPQDKNDSNCKVQSTKVSGNKVSWEIQCKNQQSGSGEMEFHDDSYSGVMRTRHPGMQGEMVMRYKGRRIGDCK